MGIEAQYHFKMRAQRPYQPDGGCVAMEGLLISVNDGSHIGAAAAWKAYVVVQALLLRFDEITVLAFQRGQFTGAPGQAHEVHHVARAEVGGALQYVDHAGEPGRLPDMTESASPQTGRPHVRP